MYPFSGSQADSSTVPTPKDRSPGRPPSQCFGECLAVGARRTYDLTHGTSRSNGRRKHRVAQPDRCAWLDCPSLYKGANKARGSFYAPPGHDLTRSPLSSVGHRSLHWPWKLTRENPGLCRFLNAGNAQGLVLDRSIVSDIYMPGMSGFELLPKARAARPDVPIIMTASATAWSAKGRPTVKTPRSTTLRSSGRATDGSFVGSPGFRDVAVPSLSASAKRRSPRRGSQPRLLPGARSCLDGRRRERGRSSTWHASQT